MPRVEAGGLSFNTAQLGSGPRLCMLHGLLLGNLAGWYFTAAPALARTHQVLLYDLRGHGHSERIPTGYDVATMVGDLEALTGGEPVSLVGHSYGAIIAMRYAADHPDRVRRLAVVDAPLPVGSYAEITAFLDLPPEQMVEALPAGAGVLRGGGRRSRIFLDGLRFLVTESTLLADLAREGDIPDADLARIRCPTLAIYGERSACRGVADRLVRVLPDCRSVLVPSGHFVPLEAPAEMTAALVEFFGG